MTTKKVGRPNKAAVKSKTSTKKAPIKPKQLKLVNAAKLQGKNGNSNHKEVTMGSSRKTASSKFTQVTTRFFVAAGLSLAVGSPASWQGEADCVGLAVAFLSH